MARAILNGLAALAAASVVLSTSPADDHFITAPPIQPRHPLETTSPIRTVVTINSNLIDVLAGDERDVPKVVEKLQQLCAGPLAYLYPEICEHFKGNGDPVEIILWPPEGQTTTTTEVVSISIFSPVPMSVPAPGPVPMPVPMPVPAPSSRLVPVPMPIPAPVSRLVPVPVPVPVPAPASSLAPVSASWSTLAKPAGNSNLPSSTLARSWVRPTFPRPGFPTTSAKVATTATGADGAANSSVGATTNVGAEATHNVGGRTTFNTRPWNTANTRTEAEATTSVGVQITVSSRPRNTTNVGIEASTNSGLGTTTAGVGDGARANLETTTRVETVTSIEMRTSFETRTSIEITTSVEVITSVTIATQQTTPTPTAGPTSAQDRPSSERTAQHSVRPPWQTPTTFETHTRGSNTTDTAESVMTQHLQPTEDAPFQCPWGPTGEGGEGELDPCSVVTIYHSTVLQQSTVILFSTVRTIHHSTIVRHSRVGTVIRNVTGIGHAPSPSWILASGRFRPNATDRASLASTRTQSGPRYMQFPTTTRQLPPPLPTDCTQTVSMLLKIRDFHTATIYPSTVTATSHILCRCANLETLFIDRPGIDIIKPRITVTATTPSTTTLVLCSPTPTDQ